MASNIDRRQQVPAALRIALYAILLGGGALSIFRVGAYSLLPVGTLLDLWVIVFIVACILRGKTATSVSVLLLLAYALTRVVPALATESPLVDFLQAYKWLLYLFAFCFAVGREWGTVRILIRVTWVLMGMALAKALLTVALLGPGARAGLLTENNFEIALFVGVAIALYAYYTPRAKFWTVVMVAGIAGLSGSRSGIVAFVVLAIYVVVQSRGMNLFGRYILALSIVAAGWFAASVFVDRASQTVGIDRLHFFDVFIAETSSWNLLTWIFGTTPLSPLSQGGCDELAYYRFLFASAGDGSCYSVIFHAFNIRVVYDAGIFGLVLAIGVSLYAMLKAGVPRITALALVAVVVANGFSVSGLNNAYVALPILLAIATVSRPSSTQGVSSRRVRRSAPVPNRA